MRWWPALAIVAACGDAGVTVRPIYDLPVDDPGALASGIDTVELAVAQAGSAQDLASVTFAPGAAAELGGVPVADDLVIHLTGRLGSSDVGYGRTCAFALSAADDPPQPHLWFSRNVRFGNVDVVPRVRRGGQAVTAPDGSAFLIGGGDLGAAAIAERFDPRRGALTDAVPLAARLGATAALFGSGATARVVVVGGVDEGGAAVGLVELIRLANDAATVEVGAVGVLDRRDLTVTTLTDGRVVVIGGHRPSGPSVGDIDVIEDRTGGVEVRHITATLAYPRAGHTATRLGDDVGAPVLVVGGVDAAGAAIADAELWKPLSGTLADPALFTRRMRVPRSHHAARLMPDGSVLIIGGVDGAGAPVASIERFTVDAGFVEVARLPDGTGLVDATATTLPDGRILVAGGRPAPGAPPVATTTLVRFDTLDGTVDVVTIPDPLAVPRAGHQATLLCDGTVLVTGGTDAPVRAERYSPFPDGRR